MADCKQVDISWCMGDGVFWSKVDAGNERFERVDGRQSLHGVDLSNQPLLTNLTLVSPEVSD